MGKGKHKGGARKFTDFAAEEQKAEKKRIEQEWRRQRGQLGSDEEDSDKEEKSGSESESEESSSESETEQPKKTKGVQGLIEIENPNKAVKPTQKKAADIDLSKTKKVELTRRQKEELARQNYASMQAECKTEQARSDLERLALIRKKREEAEKKKKEAAEAAASKAGESSNKPRSRR